MPHKIAPATVDILAGLEWNDGVARISRPLDYATEYKPADKVLRACGGTWNRRLKGHQFCGDGELLVRSAIDSGEYIDMKEEFQFFSTPPDLAERMCDAVGTWQCATVLEPSAGDGVLVQAAVNRGAMVQWYEIDERHHHRMDELSNLPGVSGEFTDFLSVKPDDTYSIVLMNPPFSKQQDIDHILHAWKFVADNYGMLVAIASAGVMFRDNKKTQAFREWADTVHAKLRELPPGTFKQSGTMVNAVMITAINQAGGDLAARHASMLAKKDKKKMR